MTHANFALNVTGYWAGIVAHSDLSHLRVTDEPILKQNPGRFIVLGIQAVQQGSFKELRLIDHSLSSSESKKHHIYPKQSQ